MVPELDAQGLLSVVDRAVLTSYAVSWAVFVRAVGELDAAGSLTADGSKAPVRAPEFLVWRDAVNILGMLAGKIMATPADRLRMRLPAAPNLDPDGILD